MPAENILKVFYIIYMCNVIYYTNFAGKYKCTLNFFYNINLPSQSEQKDSKQINCFIFLLPMIGTHWAKFYFVHLSKPTKCQMVNWIGGEQSLEFFSCPQNCRGMKVPNSIQTIDKLGNFTVYPEKIAHNIEYGINSF